jgi:hypothetical protein
VDGRLARELRVVSAPRTSRILAAQHAVPLRVLQRLPCLQQRGPVPAGAAAPSRSSLLFNDYHFTDAINPRACIIAGAWACQLTGVMARDTADWCC